MSEDMLFSEAWEQAVIPPTPDVPTPEQSVNPCIDRFGSGPQGAICRDCVHLHGFKQSAVWYKCAKRAWRSKGGKNAGTVYPGGDHRVRWPSCAKYEERKERDGE